MLVTSGHTAGHTFTQVCFRICEARPGLVKDKRQFWQKLNRPYDTIGLDSQVVYEINDNPTGPLNLQAQQIYRKKCDIYVVL